MQDDPNVYIYRIDGNDHITHVSSNWDAFAHENAWSGDGAPSSVVGCSLWEFIDGLETRYLYQQLFKRVRNGTPCGSVPFRCDAPDQRRFLDLCLTPLGEGAIELTSTLVRSEPRESVALLGENPETSTTLLRVCSMCKKLALPDDLWVEIEEGLVHHRPFEADQVPKLTHGICPDCYELFMDEFQEQRAQQDTH